VCSCASGEPERRRGPRDPVVLPRPRPSLGRGHGPGARRAGAAEPLGRRRSACAGRLTRRGARRKRAGRAGERAPVCRCLERGRFPGSWSLRSRHWALGCASWPSGEARSTKLDTRGPVIFSTSGANAKSWIVPVPRTSGARGRAGAAHDRGARQRRRGSRRGTGRRARAVRP
jgi:hypothetical protein